MPICRAYVILFCFLVVRSDARAGLTDSLVALYEFENNFLDTSNSPQTSHGTGVGGPNFAAGKIGQGLWLPGVRDYLTLGRTPGGELDFGSPAAANASDFSVAMWVRQDDLLSDPAIFSNKNWNSGANTGINWAVNGVGLFDLNTKADVGVRRDLDTASTSAPLAAGAWNFVVMTIDRDGPTKLYVNGTNTGTINATSVGNFNGSLPWNVGQDGTGQYAIDFNGVVDELAIWRRAITATEAAQLWNAGAGLALGESIPEQRLKLVVDRVSGQLTIENNTGGPQSLIGYEISSVAGAFHRAAWTPIAGRLDATGNGVIDADNRWLTLGSAASPYDLSEVSLGEGVLAAEGRITLGTSVWGRYFEDASDITFSYADPVGDEPLSGLVEFTGAPTPYAFGDLTFDGQLDSDDWLEFGGGFGKNLTGLSTAQRYRAGDLNSDGRHTLDDVLAFRIAFDAAHGSGALAALMRSVPEPATFRMMAVLALAGMTSSWRLHKRRGRLLKALALLAMAATVSAAQAGILYHQNFDGVALGPSVGETPAGANVWSNAAPAGWSIDKSGVPTGGMPEWRGWAFASPTWWATVAQDQGRTEFTKASGAIAVADPDEWDDLPRNAGTYNTFLRTPSISLAGASPGTAFLRFDSSWLPEGTQTASVGVAFDGGPSTLLLNWTSVVGDADYKAGNTNETVLAFLDNPAGAASVQLEFGMTDAENNWWWAIDNLVLFTPLTLQVDVQSGAMTLLADAGVQLTGYEISSPSHSLNPMGWAAGNFDAQNIGNPSPHVADFDENGVVAGGDLTIWRAAYGAGPNIADADRDGRSNGADFLRWQQSLGRVSDPASTWLTLLAEDDQLTESYLFGSNAIATNQSIGIGYDVARDGRDLTFTFTTLAGEIMAGAVVYVNAPSTGAAVPEPSVICLAVEAGLLAFWRRRTLRRASAESEQN